MTAPVAVVTGGSSGLGKDVASLLAGRGYRVFELSRSGADEDGVRHITCDVSDKNAVDRAIDQVLQDAGQIDLLINNAGMGVSGAAEFTSAEDAARSFQVNFFGAFFAASRVIPVMRTKNSGRILNICSVAATIPIPFQTFYASSKAALYSFSLALRNELAPFGIAVAAILPGDIATGFTGARKKEHCGDDIYGGRICRSVGKMEEDELCGSPCRKAAEQIVRIALSPRLRPSYAIGGKYRLFLLLFKLLPVALTNRIVYELYAK